MKSFIKEYWKWIFPLLLFAVLGFFFRIGMEHDPHEIESPLVDQPVPAFALPSLLNSKQILTEKMFQGKVTLLNVFASWCISCEIEHPIFMDIARSHRVRLLGLDYKDNRDKARAFLVTRGDPYSHVVFDPTGKIAIDFGVYGTPETFLIDQHGIIQDKVIGVMTQKQWQEELYPEIVALEHKK